MLCWLQYAAQLFCRSDARDLRGFARECVTGREIDVRVVRAGSIWKKAVAKCRHELREFCDSQEEAGNIHPGFRIAPL